MRTRRQLLDSRGTRLEDFNDKLKLGQGRPSSDAQTEVAGRRRLAEPDPEEVKEEASGTDTPRRLSIAEVSTGGDVRPVPCRQRRTARRGGS